MRILQVLLKHNGLVRNWGAVMQSTTPRANWLGCPSGVRCVLQVRLILPNLAMLLINLENPVVSLVLWGVRAVREPTRRVR